MIIFYVGGIGSGKTISMIKDIVDRKQRSYTNFKLYHIKDYKRLKVTDLIEITDDKETKRLKYRVNFAYWNKQLKGGKPFDISVDELHNVANSRTGSKRLNIGLNMWIAQVRKILQGNEQNNIYLTTQRPMSVDIGWRDLTHFWIVCKKYTLPVTMKTELFNGKKLKLPVCVIKRWFFDNMPECLEFMQTERCSNKTKKDKFIANKYYKYYNTFELITFGDKYL